MDVFGEGGEDAAHEESSDTGGLVVAFQVFGEGGELSGDFAGDAGTEAGGIEGGRVEPNCAEAVANGGRGEFVEENSVGVFVWELGVVFAREGEVGVEFQAVADVDDDEEGRPAVSDGFGVELGLVAGGEHRFIPARCFADGCATTSAGGCGDSWSGWAGAALLGFQNEATAFIEVDAAGAGGSVSVVEVDGAFKYVGVVMVVGDRGVGTGNTEDVAEFGEEELVVGAFGGSGTLRAGKTPWWYRVRR